MTLLAAVILAGLWQGTHVVVLAAEKLLTPQQRVEKMAQLQKELGPATPENVAKAGRALP
jgi:hypothetical protein